MSKKDLQRRLKVTKADLRALEEKCKDGSGTKEDYIALTKMRKKMR